jgi:hypothetical protein
VSGFCHSTVCPLLSLRICRRPSLVTNRRQLLESPEVPEFQYAAPE